MMVWERDRCTMARRRGSSRRDDNRAGKISISLILIVFVVVMSVQISKVYKKDQEKIAQEAQLQKQLELEQERKAELEEYEDYIESQEYVEDVAQSKLGLLYENQIIFREDND